MEKVKAYFRLFSLGKFRTQLYHRGQARYSTVGSGVLTLVLLAGILVFIGIVLVETFNRSTYQVEQSTRSLPTDQDNALRIKELIEPFT